MTSKAFHEIPFPRLINLGTVGIALSAALLGTSCSPDSSSGKAAPANQAPAEIGPDHIEIATHYAPGTRYTFEFDMSYETELDESMRGFMPEGEQATQQQKYAITAVESDSPDDLVIDFEFLRWASDAPVGGMNLSFDSANEAKEDDPAEAIFAPIRTLIGKPLRITFDSNLKVTTVEGLEEVREQALRNAPPEIGGMLESMFSKYYLENMTFPRGFPENPVQPGDSWPANITQSLGVLGTFAADMQYQFKRLEDHDGTQCAAIAFSGTVKGGKSAPSENGGMAQLMQITGGKTFGTLWYDPAQKQVTDSSVTQELQMSMSIPGLPAEAMQGGGLALQINQKYTRKLVNSEAPTASDVTAEPDL